MNGNCCGLKKLTENRENLWERACVFKLQSKSRDVFLSCLSPKFTFLVFFFCLELRRWEGSAECISLSEVIILWC